MRVPGNRPAGPTAVEEYLALLPEPTRSALCALRKTIRGAAPAAIEGITYKMPYYHQAGPLVGFAARGDHCTLYIGGTKDLLIHSKELEGWDVGRGCIRFSSRRPPPTTLVTSLVQSRVAENEAATKGERQGHEAPRRSGKS